MYSVKENWEFWQRLMDMLQHQFGENSEIILHDLTGDYNHSIVDIRNGYITGRKIGDCGTNLGLEVLRGTIKDGDRYNYIINAKDGKLLRSSTMYLKDENGQVIGSLCINTDITETVRFEDFLRRYNNYSTFQSGLDAGGVPGSSAEPSKAEPVEEIFAKDVGQVLDFLIESAEKQVGIPPSEMKRADKIAFIRYLDDRGAFLITKSAERVYSYLGISKFTFYNYLDIVHKEAPSGVAVAEE